MNSLSRFNPSSQELIPLSGGARGTRETLKIMSQLVREASCDPSIRTLAVALTRHIENQDFRSEIEACFSYVKSSIRYVMDTVGVERVENPVTLLQTRAGDCDDMCTLLAALLESIGHPCRFCAVGYNEPGQFEHVYLETRLGNRWIGLDPTQDNPIGWSPIRPYVDVECRAMMKEHI